ncbi:MAG: 1-acyl-sn-glycerol-3-phosphate acyltransferase [Bacteroidetes bacterium]|nr:1-acyl-sn-glycerol-3-phosphate acyltransferase [Bacteroidota bacterium]
MQNNSDKFIDIYQLFKDKNPAALKWIPKFVINYLKRIIHQDDMNKFMIDHKSDNAFDFCAGVIKEFGITVKVQGLENIPTSGGGILIANHPLGGFDAVALVPELGKIRKDIKYIVNDLLLNFHQLREIFTGVNKHGKNANQSIQQVDELFASDKLICLFPAGLVSRKIDGKIMDLEWKKTFITRSKKYQKDVIPVYIDGGMSNFFYRLSNIRKKIGLKANIEMLYLANEMYKQKGKTVTIIIGEPVSHSYFTKEFSDQEWAQKMKETVYKLKNKIA